ncbi:hypothetical protein DUZ99_16735 [Xylanibacillus composti]|uniref:Uncharacterized protein n=1 Tax=Xylanibacillus composti TaxID=1572762 RepID=A0A8J4H4Q5_9BACL|nr:hypothetical protein [Xylanibacillus composti]MDT9726624.1 hypothetical protein [Xylanibacillus composti]GIQ70814.1 hypothetical protein XYCOK13_36380 [Xylanibacillus composti]
MLKVLSTLLAIRTSSAINLFFYYVQKLPLIGKAIKDSVYARTDLKRSVAVLVFAVLLLWSLVSKLLYLYFLVYLPVMAMKELSYAHEPLTLFVHIFAIISFLVAGVSSANVLEPKREKYAAVKLMRMSPMHYMRAYLSYRYVVFLVSYVPALLVFVLLLQGTALQAVLLAVSVTAWRVLCEYFHLKLFEKTGIVLVKQVAVVWLVIIAGYIVAYLPLFLAKAPTIGPALMHGTVTLVIAALGAWAGVQLARYRHFREAVDAATKRDDPYLNVSSMVADAQKTSVAAKESDYSEETLRREAFKGKEGYAYLNAIFFARHRSVVSRPVYKRLAIMAAAGIISTIAMLVMGRMQLEFLQLELKLFFPFLPVALSVLTVGGTTCRAMFYNCDISLARYSFYRSAAYEHFLIRLRKMIGQNLLIAAVLGGVLTLATFSADGSILQVDTVLLWLSIAALAVFFTIHHLFLYYMFQPNSTDLNVKNPLYFIVTMVVSGACGFALFFPVPPAAFTSVVLSITCVYFLLALVIVRKYAHHTFRVK